MLKKISSGLIAILALAACGDANNEATADNITSQPAATNAVGTATPDVIKSPETAPTEAKQSVSEDTDKSHSPDKSDPGVKIADCKIMSIAGDAQYKGDCEFLPHGGGSFTVKRSNGQSFVDGITAFVLELDTKTAAGLSVRDANGDLPYVGTAERSTADSACWENQYYSICVYAK